MATDPMTAQTASESVTDTIIGHGIKNLVDVTIDIDGDRGDVTGTVTATDNHPFWVPALHDWVQAGTLGPNQWLQTSAGTRVQITAVQPHTEVATVYNLGVANIHTYYVLAGSTAVLVHNAGCGGILGIAPLGSLKSSRSMARR